MGGAPCCAACEGFKIPARQAEVEADQDWVEHVAAAAVNEAVNEAVKAVGGMSGDPPEEPPTPSPGAVTEPPFCVQLTTVMFFLFLLLFFYIPRLC